MANVPIIASGSFCVGATGLLTACCPSDAEVTWTIEDGIGNVSTFPAPNGRDLFVFTLAAGGFKARAECCTERE